MKISFKAVIIGGVVDVVLSNILAIPLVMYAWSSAGGSRVPPEQMTHTLITTLHNNPLLLTGQFLTGTLSSIIGGYVAALLAKQDKILNAVLASWLCLSFGIYSLVSGRYELSLLWQIASMVATPAYYWIGGIVFLKLRRGKPVAAQID